MGAKILNIVSGIIMVFGLFVLYGTAGSSDLNKIDISTKQKTKTNYSTINNPTFFI